MGLGTGVWLPSGVVAVGGSYVAISYRVHWCKFCPCLLSLTDGHWLPLSGIQGIELGESQSPARVRMQGKQEEFDQPQWPLQISVVAGYDLGTSSSPGASPGSSKVHP